MGSTTLHVANLCKTYGATRALDALDMSVSSGSIHALIGENGAGKSTLVKILSGVVQPDAGKMTLGSAPFSPSEPAAARGAGIATVHQELSLAPHLTVRENIYLGREIRRYGLLDREGMRSGARGAFERLGREDISPDRLVSTLSIADRQIVEIARVLLSESRLLILDEPTSSLSNEDAALLFSVLRRLRDDGLAILYISHLLEEISDLTDTWTVLRDGALAGTGTTAKTTEDRLTELMIGRRLTGTTGRRTPRREKAILEVHDLSGQTGLHHASFALHKGEILGIGGLVGSGRTELMRTLYGLDAVLSGEVRVHDVTGTALPHRRLTQGVGFLSEDRALEGLALPLSIADNMAMSRLPTRQLGLIDRVEQTVRTKHWIDALAIRCGGPGQSVRHLSGGNQQKVALARLLHHDVDILLLDEPTRGIDVGSKAIVHETIHQLADTGKAILLTSSHLSELTDLCDRIAIAYRGRIGQFRPADEVTEHDLMAEATRGPKSESGTGRG